MTRILTWNIQNGKGVDDSISLERIVSVIAQIGDPDVICFQEISRYMALGDGWASPDQIAEISGLFPGYEAIFGPAVEGPGAGSDPRWQFGNVTLSRLPVLSVFRHSLPQPSDPGLRHMARQATEITVETAPGPLRVTNTHLEFHSTRQRLAQVRRLRAIQADIVGNAEQPPAHDATGPYQNVQRPVDCVLCGDFNMEVDSTEYAMLTDATDSGRLQDAWRSLYRDVDHQPTCGVHDLKQWPQGAHCRDFFFVSQAVSQRVSSIVVDTDTNASDHQPLMMTLES
jgi:endonuclease/exonuclease/phosphatase family metal-dependent hydrolase